TQPLAGNSNRGPTASLPPMLRRLRSGMRGLRSWRPTLPTENRRSRRSRPSATAPRTKPKPPPGRGWSANTSAQSRAARTFAAWTARASRPTLIPHGVLRGIGGSLPCPPRGLPPPPRRRRAMADWKEALAMFDAIAADARVLPENAASALRAKATIRAHIEGLEANIRSLSPLNYEERCRLRDA